MNLVARSDVPKAESAIAVQSRDGIDLPRHRSTIWIDPCHPSPTKSRAKLWKAYSKLVGRIIRPYRHDDLSIAALRTPDTYRFATGPHRRIGRADGRVREFTFDLLTVGHVSLKTKKHNRA